MRVRYKTLARNLAAEDFTLDLGFTSKFGLVIGRAAVTQNDSAAISRCLDSVHAQLKEGDGQIAIDWFSLDHSDFRRGKAGTDMYTRDACTAFEDLGKGYFSDKAHIDELFRRFQIVVLEYAKI